MENIIYAGTYTSKGSKGVYRFAFKDGVLGKPELFSEIRNPKYITIHNDTVTTLGDFNHESGVAVLDEKGEISRQIAFEERTSCFVTRTDDRIYTANYHTGTVTAVADDGERLRLLQSVQIQDGAGCHQVLLWRDQVLVPCLFLDRVIIFDQDLNRIGSLRFPAGTGPRHGVFSKDGEYLYLVGELSNELFIIKTGTWTIEHQISVLPNHETHVRDTAAIRLSEDERFLYVSTRTKDVISVIELTDHEPKLIQTVWCGGKHPRDFILIDHYLLCANRHSNEVVCFEVREDGTIGKVKSHVEVMEPVSLAY